MTIIQQPILGEVQCVQQGSQSLMTISCLINKSSSISILILDEKGRVMGEHNIVLNESQTNIVLKIPRLKSGLYNFWIDVGQKTHIRQLDIVAARPRRMMSRFLKMD